MYYECPFNKERDLHEVSPTGFIDIVKMNRMSSLDIPVGLVDVQYNDIDDPRSIGDRPSDVFEAMQAEKAMSDYKAPKSDDK